jgi:eukaryotic-like serine/threonine-protein kinase
MSSRASHTIFPACKRYMLLCLAMLSACSGLRIPTPLKMDPSDWAMFARDASRTNASSEVVTPPLTTEWECDITGGIGNGSVLVVDSVLFVGNLRGELHAINARTGKRIGWIDLGDAIQGTPVIDGYAAIVPLSNTEFSLVAFDLLEGRPLWRRNYGDLEASPLLHTQKIFVGNTEGAFSCIDRTTGDQLWKYELPVNARHKGIRSSAAGIDTMVVFGAEDGFLYALNADRGTQVWRHNTGASIVGSPCIANGNVYIGNLSGTICGVDLRSGKPRWQFEAGADIYASPSCADNKVFIGTSGGIMYALDAMTGTLVWKTDLGSVINSSAVIAGDVLYVGTLKKMLFGLNIVDGTPVLKQEVPGRIKTSPTVARGRLFVATDEKLILSFRSATR